MAERLGVTPGAPAVRRVGAEARPSAVYADLRPAVVRGGTRAEVVDFRAGDPRTGRCAVPEELRLRGPAGPGPAPDLAVPREALLFEHWVFTSEAPEGPGASAPSCAAELPPGRVPALVVRPPRPKGVRKEERLPCLVFLHDLGACKEELIPRLEVAAQRGYCAMAIDARFHGQRQGGDPRALARHLRSAFVRWRAATPEERENLPAAFVLDTAFDTAALLDFACLRPDVDRDRVGLVGVGTLGGAAAAALAAVDERVACCCLVAGLWSLPWALENEAWAPLVQNTIRRGCDLHLVLGCECPDAVQKALKGLDPGEDKTPGGPPGRSLVDEAFRAWIPGICDRWDPADFLKNLAPRPCLVVAGELDEKCPCDVAELAVARARGAYAAAGQPECLQLRVLPGAGDFLPREADAAVDDFVDRFLLKPAPDAAREAGMGGDALSLRPGTDPASAAVPEPPRKYGEFTACPIDLGVREGYVWRPGPPGPAAPRGAGYYIQD